ncbi:MAG: fibronectin type III domain-containing protein [Gammaproteobacteria bacterium]|jgi:hypothetical protein
MTALRCISPYDEPVRRALLLAVACLLAAAPLQTVHPAPRLDSDRDIAAAGFYRLAWETDAERIELQEATGPGFQKPLTLYTGPDRATVISGKPDGTWYYRVRAAGNPPGGPWSDPVAVTVAHHSLSRALLFLALGVGVFVAIVGVIVRAAGQTP